MNEVQLWEQRLQVAHQSVMDILLVLMDFEYEPEEVEAINFAEQHTSLMNAVNVACEYQDLSLRFEIPDHVMNKYLFLCGLLESFTEDEDEEEYAEGYDPNAFGEDEPKRGYSVAEIDTFAKRRAFNGRLKLQVTQPLCTVCLDDFEKGRQVRKLNCGHIYHDECLERWLDTHTTCPVCVVDVSKPEAHKLPKKAAALHGKKRALDLSFANEMPVTRERSKRLRGLPPDQ